MALPTLTAEQRAAALAKAAESRRVRAAWKNSLSQREISATTGLEQAFSNEILTRTRVSEFLQSLPGLGKVKATEAMQGLKIAENRRIKGLGAGQLEAVRELCRTIDEKQGLTHL